MDVIRVNELSNAYSFTIGGHAVIAIQATGNWFWENWSIAHELAHLALGHHRTMAGELGAALEAQANAVAAELLLPAEEFRELDWGSVTDRDYAQWLWDWGVSTKAVMYRFKTLLASPPDVVSRWSQQPTKQFLSSRLEQPFGVDEVTVRMTAAAQRRFPLSLREAHLERINAAELRKDTLAWMLGIEPDAMAVDEPAVDQVDLDALVNELGL